MKRFLPALLLVFLTPSLSHAQQKFTFTQADLDRLNPSGYLKPSDYQLFTGRLNQGHEMSIFSLIDKLQCWKNLPGRSADLTPQQMADFFAEGALKSLQASELLTVENYQTICRWLRTGRLENAQSMEPYRLLTALALWQDFFRNPANLRKTYSSFQEHGLFSGETTARLASDLEAGRLTLEAMMRHIEGFHTVEVKSGYYPWKDGMARLQALVESLVPDLHLNNCDCAPDYAFLDNVDFFTKGDKFYSIRDSSEITLPLRCTLQLSLGNLHQEPILMAEKQGFMDVWQWLSQENMVRSINQLLIDHEQPERLMIFNLSETGPVAQSQAATTALTDELPVASLYPVFMPVYFKGTEKELIDLSHALDELDFIEGIFDREFTSYNHRLNRHAQELVLIPLSAKRSVAQFLQEINLLSSQYRQPEEVTQYIETSYFNTRQDILFLKDIKTFKISPGEGRLYAEKFSETSAPEYNVFDYFNNLSGGRFKVSKVVHTKETVQRVRISFLANNHPSLVLVDLAKRDPYAYLGMCKSIFEVAQQEGLFLGYSLYWLPSNESTSLYSLIFPLKLDEAARWEEIFLKKPMLVK